MADTLYPDLDALQELLQALAGPRVHVVCDGAPERFEGFSDVTPQGVPLMTVDPAAVIGSPALKVVYAISAWTGHQQDDWVRSFDEGTDQLTLTLQGLRHFTLTLRAESDAATCHAVIERLRSLMTVPSTLQALSALGIAVREVSETRAIKVPDVDRRTYDASLCEVFCTFAVEMADPIGETGTEAPGAYIQTVGPLTWTGE